MRTRSRLFRHHQLNRRMHQASQFSRDFHLHRLTLTEANCLPCCGIVCGFFHWQQVNGRWFIETRCTRVRQSVLSLTPKPKIILFLKATPSLFLNSRSHHEATSSATANTWYGSKTMKKSLTQTQLMLWCSWDTIWQKQLTRMTLSKSMTFISSLRFFFVTLSQKWPLKNISVKLEINDQHFSTNLSNCCLKTFVNHGLIWLILSTFKKWNFAKQKPINFYQ